MIGSSCWFRLLAAGSNRLLQAGCDLLGKVDDAVGITPFVVIPSDQLEELAVKLDRGARVVDRAVLIVNKV